MKIQNPFRVGLLAGLGALIAVTLGTMVGQLSTILTYVALALFLALGLEPLVAFLERRRIPRWLALLLVLVIVVGVFTALALAIVPLLVRQAGVLVASISQYASGVDWNGFLNDLQAQVGGGVDVRAINDQIVQYLQANFSTIGGGVLAVGASVVSGVFGTIIVLILTLYFASSLNSITRGLYKLVPATKRAKFADLTEQIMEAVGRFVVGQVALALCNGILSFVFLSVIGAQLPVVFAFTAFLFSLVPLVGTLTGSVLIVLGQVLLLPDSPPTWIAAGVYYLVYMQVEAYVLSPNIMKRAVKVPGVIVVIAALIGGTLLGVLGALIAIPVAASVLLIVEQVLIPRQQER